jgi:hypothetical protein
MAQILGLVLAAVSWVAVRRWQPANRWLWALRFSLYGAVVGAYFSAGEIVKGDAVQALATLLGGWLVFFPILFSVGVVLSAKRLGLSRPR